MDHNVLLGVPFRADVELPQNVASTHIHTQLIQGQAQQDPHSWTSLLEEWFFHAFAVV